MLKEILKECIREMIEDPMYLYAFRSDMQFNIISYRLKRLGMGNIYVCECEKIDSFIYVAEERVRNKIEEKRNKRIEEIIQS